MCEWRLATALREAIASGAPIHLRAGDTECEIDGELAIGVLTLVEAVGAGQSVDITLLRTQPCSRDGIGSKPLVSGTGPVPPGTLSRRIRRPSPVEVDRRERTVAQVTDVRR